MDKRFLCRWLFQSRRHLYNASDQDPRLHHEDDLGPPFVAPLQDFVGELLRLEVVDDPQYVDVGHLAGPDLQYVDAGLLVGPNPVPQYVVDADQDPVLQYVDVGLLANQSPVPL